MVANHAIWHAYQPDLFQWNFNCGISFGHIPSTQTDFLLLDLLLRFPKLILHSRAHFFEPRISFFLNLGYPFFLTDMALIRIIQMKNPNAFIDSELKTELKNTDLVQMARAAGDTGFWEQRAFFPLKKYAIPGV